VPGPTAIEKALDVPPGGTPQKPRPETQGPFTLEAMSATEGRRPRKSSPGDPSKRTPAKRIDWEGAFFVWVSVPASERTFAQVSRQFAVSRGRVARVAREKGWVERAVAFDRKHQAELERNAIRARALRDADTIRVIDAARLRFAQQLADPDFRLTAEGVVALLKMERLIEGESSDKVAIAAEIEAKLAGLPLPVVERIAVALIRGEPVNETIEGMAQEVEGRPL
jgi:hypothetical protein